MNKTTRKFGKAYVTSKALLLALALTLMVTGCTPLGLNELIQTLAELEAGNLDGAAIDVTSDYAAGSSVGSVAAEQPIAADGVAYPSRSWRRAHDHFPATALVSG